MKRLISFLLLVLIILSVLSGCTLTKKIPVSTNNEGKNILERGGVRAVFIVDEKDSSYKPAEKDLETIRTIINNRLDRLGILNKEVKKDESGEIVVDFAYNEGFEIGKIQAAIDIVSKKGAFSVQEVDESKKSADGQYLSIGKHIFTGIDIKEVSANDTKDGKMNLYIELSSSGARKFEDATQRLIGKPVGVFMDDKLLSSPTVAATIKDGKLEIAGLKDKTETINLMVMIKSGELPYRLTIKEMKTVNPAK